MITMHASVLELIWLIVACCAATAGMIYALALRLDAQRYRKSPIALHRFMTAMLYHTAIVQFLKSLFSVVASIWAVLHVPPPPSLWESPQAVVMITTILIISLLSFYQAMLGLRWRHAMSVGDYGEDVGRRSTDLPDQVLTKVAVNTQRIKNDTETIKDTLHTNTDALKETIEASAGIIKNTILNEKNHGS